MRGLDVAIGQRQETVRRVVAGGWLEADTTILGTCTFTPAHRGKADGKQRHGGGFWHRTDGNASRGINSGNERSIDC